MLRRSRWFTDRIQEERSENEERRSVRTDGGFKEQAQTESIKATGDR